MEILRDPIWQFWGVIVTVFLFIVTTFLQRNKKRLAYYILTETALLSINDEIKGKIKIKYGSKNIQNMHLVMLYIGNNGNVHIAASDYEQPIIFSFPSSEILSAEVVDIFPKNLRPTIKAEMEKLIVNPILLNKGDFMVIKLLFSNYAKLIDIDSRIMGVKEIEKLDRSMAKVSVMRIFIEVAIASAVLFGVYLLTKSLPESVLDTVIPLISAVCFFLLGMLITLLVTLAKDKA